LTLARSNRFADGIDAWVQLVGDVRADHANAGPMVFIRLCKEAAIGDVNVSNGGEIWSGAYDADILAHYVSVADVGGGVLLAGYLIGQFHVVTQSFKIVHLQRRTLSGFVPFLKIRDDANAVHDKGVGTEVGHFVGDIDVEPVQNRNHRDERCDGEDYAKQGQERTELVGAQGIERNPEGLTHGDERLPDFSQGWDGFVHFVYIRRIRVRKSSYR
jgi:hypothetical protein